MDEEHKLDMTGIRQVTTLEGMFEGCTSFGKEPIELDVPEVADLQEAFKNCDGDSFMAVAIKYLKKWG